jgi:hypothetical protein
VVRVNRSYLRGRGLLRQLHYWRVILSEAKDLSKSERSHSFSLRARRWNCEVPHFVRDDPFEMVRAIYQATAVSFGISIVPLNFGGSSSIPKFSE